MELQISKSPSENCQFQLEISHNINLQLGHHWKIEKEIIYQQPE